MSCLFVSLSNFFNLDSDLIRSVICDYLDKNEKLIEDLDTEIILSLDVPKDVYLNEMRRQTTWGGAIEIQAACNIWNVRILIHNIRDINNVQIIEFLPLTSTKITINLTWNGNHYEALLT
jgi:hypothetical protein